MSDEDDGTGASSPNPRDRLDEIERLGRLGHVLRDPLGLRITAALLTLEHGNAETLSHVLGEEVDTVLEHVRLMHAQGVLVGEFWVPDMHARQASVSLIPSLQAALPQILRQLGGPSPGLVPADEAELAGVTFLPTGRRAHGSRRSRDDPLVLSYYLLRSQAAAPVNSVALIARVGTVLSSRIRVRILRELLLDEPATTEELSALLGETTEVVAVDVARLADAHAIRPVAGHTDQWTITAPMKKALGGFYDYLIVVQDLGGAGRATIFDEPCNPDAGLN